MQQLETATVAALGGASAALSPAVKPVLTLSLQPSVTSMASQQVLRGKAAAVYVLWRAAFTAGDACNSGMQSNDEAVASDRDTSRRPHGCSWRSWRLRTVTRIAPGCPGLAAGRSRAPTRRMCACCVSRCRRRTSRHRSDSCTSTHALESAA